MAEILLQWVDKVPSSDPLYGKNYKQGDVIALCPDGWAWSSLEQTNPNWRIVKLPNVTVAQIQNLIAVEFDPITEDIVNKRTSYINGTAIPKNVYNQIDKNQVLTSQIDYTTILGWIAKRA